MADRSHFRTATITGSVAGYRPSATSTRPRWRVPWPLVLALAGLAILGWFLFGSGRFTIRTIKITGSVNAGVSQSLDQLRGRNILLVSTRNLDASLPTAQSSIASLRIIKGFPDTLRVNVTVRQPRVRWKSNDQLALLDESGVVFTLDPPPTAAVADPLPLVTDPKNLPLKLGQPLVAPAFVGFVVDLSHTFHDRTKLELVGMSIGETVGELDVTTANHLMIRFDPTRSLDPQLATLASVLGTYGSDIHESVDLRVVGRVFYK